MRMSKKEKEAMVKIAILCELLVDAIDEREMITNKKLKRTKLSQSLDEACKYILSVTSGVVENVGTLPDVKSSTFFHQQVNKAEKIIFTKEYNFLERKNKFNTLVRHIVKGESC